MITLQEWLAENDFHLEEPDASDLTECLLLQITDDLLDEVGDAKKMGKRLRKDAKRGKQTYPRVHGIDASRALAEKLAARAERALAGFDRRARMLIEVPRYLLERGN